MSHIIIDARISGTTSGRYIDKLIEHLHNLTAKQQAAHQYTILTKPHRLDYIAEVAPSFRTIASPYKEFTFDEQLGLMRQLHELKPDLVHFAMVQQPVLFNDCPVVTTMHDLTTIRFKNPAKNPLVFTAKQQIYKWVNKRVAQTSAAIIVPSEFVKQDVMAYCHVSAEKITVTLESSDDLPTPAAPVDALDGKQFIMYLGRPTPHKNLERLIQAFAKLQPRHTDLYLALAGKKDANYERIESDVKKQGIERVVFTDFTSDQQLRWMYEHCAAYIFPSLSEGFGLPGLEAMRHGAPVASSSATCLPEVYGDAAHYFDPLNTEDMTQKINDLLSDEDLRQKLIIAGRTHAATFSWQRMAEQTLAVYDTILRR